MGQCTLLRSWWKFRRLSLEKSTIYNNLAFYFKEFMIPIQRSQEYPLDRTTVFHMKKAVFWPCPQRTVISGLFGWSFLEGTGGFSWIHPVSHLDFFINAILSMTMEQSKVNRGPGNQIYGLALIKTMLQRNELKSITENTVIDCITV